MREIGKKLGITREEVVAALRSLERDGLVHVNRRRRAEPAGDPAAGIERWIAAGDRKFYAWLRGLWRRCGYTAADFARWYWRDRGAVFRGLPALRDRLRAARR